MDEGTLTAGDEGSAAFVGALIVRDGMLLLGRRSSEKAVCPETWDVIGGHVEAGETFDGALLRELDEEIGVHPLVYGEHSRHPLPEGGMLVLYVVTHWVGGEPRLQNTEHVELSWFPIQAACTLPQLAALEYVPVFRSLDVVTHVPPGRPGV
jgi:8-oxo-dGTP diphosphatase